LRNISSACEHQSNKIDTFPKNNFAGTKNASQQHSDPDYRDKILILISLQLSLCEVSQTFAIAEK